MGANKRNKGWQKETNRANSPEKMKTEHAEDPKCAGSVREGRGLTMGPVRGGIMRNHHGEAGGREGLDEHKRSSACRTDRYS